MLVVWRILDSLQIMVWPMHCLSVHAIYLLRQQASVDHQLASVGCQSRPFLRAVLSVHKKQNTRNSEVTVQYTMCVGISTSSLVPKLLLTGVDHLALAQHFSALKGLL